MLGRNSVSSLQHIFGGTVFLLPSDFILQWVADPRVDGVMKRNQSKKKQTKKSKSSKPGYWESSLNSPSPATTSPCPVTSEILPVSPPVFTVHPSFLFLP